MLIGSPDLLLWRSVTKLVSGSRYTIEIYRALRRTPRSMPAIGMMRAGMSAGKVKYRLSCSSDRWYGNVYWPVTHMARASDIRNIGPNYKSRAVSFMGMVAIMLYI